MKPHVSQHKARKSFFFCTQCRDQLKQWRCYAVNASTATEYCQTLLKGFGLRVGCSNPLISQLETWTWANTLFFSLPLSFFLLPLALPSLCYTFLSLRPPSLSISVIFFVAFILADTGDNFNSKHCRLKTNPFCHNENKPPSLLFSSPLLFSPPLSCLATVKINYSVFIYFTKQDSTTTEFPPGHLNLSLPNFPVRTT